MIIFAMYLKPLCSACYIIAEYLTLIHCLHITVVRPTGDILQNDQLNISALECLQHMVKMPLFQSIGAKWQYFAVSLEMTQDLQTQIKQQGSNTERGRAVISMWLKGELSKPATWSSLVKVLASSKGLNRTLAKLADAIERFVLVESAHELQQYKVDMDQQLRKEKQLASEREEESRKLEKQVEMKEDRIRMLEEDHRKYQLQKDEVEKYFRGRLLASVHLCI